MVIDLNFSQIVFSEMQENSEKYSNVSKIPLKILNVSKIQSKRIYLIRKLIFRLLTY